MRDTSKDTPRRAKTISPERLAARERLKAKFPPQPWMPKSGTVVVVATPFKPSEQDAGKK